MRPARRNTLTSLVPGGLWKDAIALESGRTGRMQRQSRCEPGYDERERSAYERIARSFKPGTRRQERRMRIFKWKKLVSLMLVGVFCGSAVSASAFADDDGRDQPPAKPAAGCRTLRV